MLPLFLRIVLIFKNKLHEKELYDAKHSIKKKAIRKKGNMGGSTVIQMIGIFLLFIPSIMQCV